MKNPSARKRGSVIYRQPDEAELEKKQAEWQPRISIKADVKTTLTSGRFETKPDRESKANRGEFTTKVATYIRHFGLPVQSPEGVSGEMRGFPPMIQLFLIARSEWLSCIFPARSRHFCPCPCYS
jgi:hypothetical protein